MSDETMPRTIWAWFRIEADTLRVQRNWGDVEPDDLYYAERYRRDTEADRARDRALADELARWSDLNQEEVDALLVKLELRLRGETL